LLGPQYWLIHSW